MVKLPSPLVIAHRGASGYRPEHTVSAYELAVQMGADYIEPDLVMTKDGVLVDRHEPEIGETTDIADHPELAHLRTTRVIDGVERTGWFADDLTLAELKTLRARERLPELRPGSAAFDGRDEVLTFEECLQLRARLARQHGRPVGIIPELKQSTYLHGRGLAPEAAFVRLVRRYRLNSRRAPMWVQSFELGNLRALKEEHGYKARTTFLSTATGAPFDLVVAGDGRGYADLLAPESLAELASFVDGLGPEKAQVVPRAPDGSLGEPTPLVADAHRHGMLVTPWTFRAENTFLPSDLQVGDDPSHLGHAVEEVAAFLRAGVDGVFSDHPDLAVLAREQVLAERG